MKNEKTFHESYDPSLFKSRLAKLMIEKGMVNKNGNPDHGKLYMALYPKGKRGNGVDIIKSNTTKSRINEIARAQMDWLRGEHLPASWEDMARLCNVLECDMDYLMGLESDHANRDEQFVCEYLGLSRNVISKLHQMALFNKWDMKDSKNVPIGPAFKSDDSFLDEIKYKLLAKEIMHGIELIFTNKDDWKEPKDEHIADTRDYSILFSFIHELCCFAPNYLYIDRYTDDEYEEKYREMFEGYAQNPHYSMSEKDGIEIWSDKAGLYEEICIEMAQYHKCSISNDGDDFYDFNLKDILNQITRNSIDDLLKEISKQFVKMDNK